MQALSILTGAVLVSAVVLGGATHSGFISDVVVQAFAALLLGAAVWRWASHPPSQLRSAFAATLCSTAVLLAFLVIQSLPLGFASPHSLPVEWSGALSAAPQATLAAGTSFVVPLALFLAAIQLDPASRIRLCIILVALGAASLVLGVLQMAQGPSSVLRFYANTNSSEAVGFFANRNHLAALLAVTVILGGIWFAPNLEKLGQRGEARSPALLSVAAWLAFIMMLLGGLALTRSRAGLALWVIGIVGILALFAARQRDLSDGAATRQQTFRTGVWPIAFGILAIAVVIALEAGLSRISSRFDTDALKDERWPLAQSTFATAVKAMPFGTGLGSFVRVHAVVEPDERATGDFANRAHNDLLEILLETGVFGLCLLIGFLTWLAAAASAAWARRAPDLNADDVALPRAASIAILMLLIHSLVDYPLRTTAHAAVFAVACAWLVRPQLRPVPSSRPPARVKRAQVPQAPAVHHPAVTQWPDAWNTRGRADDRVADDTRPTEGGDPIKSSNV